MYLEDLRKKLECCLLNAIKNPEKRKIRGVTRRATGSASGLPFESWTKDVLRNCGFSAFLQEEFLNHVVSSMRQEGYTLSEIRTIITEQTWWGLKDYMISKRQLEAALSGSDIPTYQQSIADIVLFYGSNIVKDINDIIAINVKSHDIEKESRDPNIISAKRVLEFSKDLLEKTMEHPDFIDKANLWFIGFYYKRYRDYAEIREVHIRDLFKLDVTKIPVINFDAAIQIQWHVKNMIEKNNIDKLTFIENLIDEYLKRWNEFVKRRTANIKNTTDELKSLIKRIRNQKASKK